MMRFRLKSLMLTTIFLVVIFVFINLAVHLQRPNRLHESSLKASRIGTTSHSVGLITPATGTQKQSLGLLQEKTKIQFIGGNLSENSVNFVHERDIVTPIYYVEVKRDHPIKREVSESVLKVRGIERLELLDVEDDEIKKAISRKRKYIPEEERDRTYSPERLRTRALMYSNDSAMGQFLQEQKHRQTNIREQCSKNLMPVDLDLHSGMGPPKGLSSIHNLILDRSNYITFCPIFKSASTSWSINLLQLNGLWNQNTKKKALQPILNRVFPKVSNFAGPALTKDTTKFMVVRHPFDRLLSCYRDKFEGGTKDYYYLRYGEKIVETYRKTQGPMTPEQKKLMLSHVKELVELGKPVVLPDNPFANPVGPTFPEFVQHVSETQHDDEHWRLYEAHCAPCNLHYDFIIKFERQYTEGKNLIEYLNRTEVLRPRWDNPTSGSTTTEVACSYYRQLSVYLMQKLYEKYERDFKMFEYDPEKYLKCANNYSEGLTIVAKPSEKPAIETS